MKPLINSFNPAIAACGVVLVCWGLSTKAHAQKDADSREETAERASPAAPARSLFPTDIPITIGNRTYQPAEISDFILPPGRSYLTKEERKRLMETPGLKYVRKGPKGTPFYNTVTSILEPWDDHQFRINFWIEDKIMLLEDVELDAEVGRRFMAERPENPGRARSFPVWKTVERPGLPSIPLFLSGWSLTVRKVQRIGPLGAPSSSVDWKAWVTVTPIVRDEYYEQAQAVPDFHEEVYVFQDGKLTLKEEHPDPHRTSDPKAGVRASFKGRMAPIQIIPEPVAPKPSV